MTRPVALVTGVGRTVGIGAAISARLAVDGWDIAVSRWTPYEHRMQVSFLLSTDSGWIHGRLLRSDGGRLG